MEPLNRSYERKRISTMSFGLVLLLACTVGVSYVLYALVQWFVPAFFTDPEGSGWLASVSQYLIATPVCALMISLVPADRMEKYSLHLRDIRRFFLISCMVLFFGNLLGWAAETGVARLLHLPAENPAETLLNNYSLLFGLVTSVVLAPITEEWIFRKLLMDRLNRLGDAAAIGYSALLFGLFHGNLRQFFYAFGIGLVFGYIYVRTGKLRYTILLHMLINLLFGVLPTLTPEVNLTVLGQSISLTLLLWTLFEAVLAVAGLVSLIRSRKLFRLRRGWVDLPGGHWGGLAFGNAGTLILLLFCGLLFAANLTGYFGL